MFYILSNVLTYISLWHLGTTVQWSLERTNKKFIKRFQYLESKAGELGKPLMDMTLAEMDVFWNEAKKL